VASHERKNSPVPFGRRSVPAVTPGWDAFYQTIIVALRMRGAKMQTPAIPRALSLIRSFNAAIRRQGTPSNTESCAAE
jgi:hypothetical protein